MNFQENTLNPNRRLFAKNAAKIFDLLVLSISYGFTTALLYSDLRSTSLTQYLAYRVKIVNLFHFGLFLSAWLVIFTFCDLYVSKRLATLFSEIVEVFKATTLSAGFLLVTARFFHLRTITPQFVAIFWATTTLLLILSRVVVRLFLRMLRSRGQNMRVMVIFGTNRRAIEFAKRIQTRPELGYQIHGFVDDDWEGTEEFISTGNSICCDIAGFRHYLRHHVVDEVAIFAPLRSFYEYASQVVALCEQHGIVIRFDTQIFDLKIARSGADELDGQAHITAGATPHDGWQMFMKRTVDLVISLVLLIVLSPFLVAVAIAIKMTSSGPIFFRQRRVGVNKRQFTMYKFRTMVPNAEQLQELLLHKNEMNGPVFKIKHDPRVTAIGKILRKASIDELPQLLNVLRGDMSLVGPRAMSVRDYEFFDQDWQRRRFSVRPGITCLWQVKGRNNVPFEQWMELDMQYIDKWSLWLDFKILVRTIPAVIRGAGAA
jgi:exopolysaccharide biosynthesis polyprenyl glycosylphosphotransferase